MHVDLIWTKRSLVSYFLALLMSDPSPCSYGLQVLAADKVASVLQSRGHPMWALLACAALRSKWEVRLQSSLRTDRLVSAHCVQPCGQPDHLMLPRSFDLADEAAAA